MWYDRCLTQYEGKTSLRTTVNHHKLHIPDFPMHWRLWKARRSVVRAPRRYLPTGPCLLGKGGGGRAGGVQRWRRARWRSLRRVTLLGSSLRGWVGKLRTHVEPLRQANRLDALGEHRAQCALQHRSASGEREHVREICRAFDAGGPGPAGRQPRAAQRRRGPLPGSRSIPRGGWVRGGMRRRATTSGGLAATSPQPPTPGWRDG